MEDKPMKDLKERAIREADIFETGAESG